MGTPRLSGIRTRNVGNYYHVFLLFIKYYHVFLILLFINYYHVFLLLFAPISYLLLSDVRHVVSVTSIRNKFFHD
jgi:hypothetical protein